MEDLIDEILDITDVKAVKREGENLLKIELFTREIKGSDAVEIASDLRSLSQKVRNCFDSAVSRQEITGWNWVQKPEKKYQETSLSTEKVSDRKSRGYEPGYYLVSMDG